jgi:O-antigen ligase
MLLTITLRPGWAGEWRIIRSTALRAGLPLALAALGIALALLPLRLVAAGLLGTIVLSFILLRPILGLITLIPLIPFSSLLGVQVGGVSVGGMEALLALVLSGWLLRMATQRRIVIPHPPLLLPWLLWLGIILASWSGALSLGDALAESLKWLEMLALYLFIAANVKRPHLPWLVGAILLAGMVQAALGLYQFLFRVGPEGFLLYGGRFLRAYGTFRQPNPYAGYLGLVLPMTFSLALWGMTKARLPSTVIRRTPSTNETRAPFQSRKTSHSLLRTPYSLLPTSLFTLAFGLMLAALYASQSRGAWIGFAAAVVTVSLVRGGRTAAVSTLVIAVLALLGAMGIFQLLPHIITQRFADAWTALSVPDIATAEVTDANFAAIGRVAHWIAALHMWRDHLWLGVGFGNYATIYPAYAIGRWIDPLGHAHNYYLNVGAEVGLVGILAYLFFWASAFWLGWRAVRRSRGFQQAVAAGGIGVLVHLSLHNLVDNLFVQGMYLHVAVILGLLCLICDLRVGRTGIDNSGRKA